MLNLACKQPTPTFRKKIGRAKRLLARRRFTWGRINVINTRCNQQKERAYTETQLNMYGIKSTNSYLQRLTWSSHSEAHLQFFCGHVSRSISAGNQLPATCVNLAQSDCDVSAIIRIERNWDKGFFICGLKWNLIFKRISLPNDADNFKEGVRLAHTFSFETLTFCSALSLVSVTSKRLYGDYISTEHINHRVLAPLAVVFLWNFASDGFQTLRSRDLSDSVA